MIRSQARQHSMVRKSWKNPVNLAARVTHFAFVAIPRIPRARVQDSPRGPEYGRQRAMAYKKYVRLALETRLSLLLWFSRPNSPESGIKDSCFWT